MEQESTIVFGKRQVAQFIEHDTFHSGETGTLEQFKQSSARQAPLFRHMPIIFEQGDPGVQNAHQGGASTEYHVDIDVPSLHSGSLSAMHCVTAM